MRTRLFDLNSNNEMGDVIINAENDNHIDINDNLNHLPDDENANNIHVADDNEGDDNNLSFSMYKP